MLLPTTLLAQAVPSRPESGGRPIIRAVEIRRHGVFDSTEATNWIFRTANSLHATTRNNVIRRELLFRPGEPYDSARVAETARNLRSLGVFRSVDIDTMRTDSGLVARVVTRDGWSTRLDFRFKSTGDQIIFTAGILESNLFGTITEASVWYRKDPDRSSWVTTFRQPRLLWNAVGVGVRYDDRSDGRIISGTITQPFFSLSSPHGFQVDGEDRDERILRFFDGSDVARDTVRRRFVLGRAEYGVALRASPTGYLRVGINGQIRREDYLPEALHASTPFTRTLTGAIGGFAEWRLARYIVAQGFQGFGRQEDVDVSSFLRLGVNVAPRAFGYDRDGVGPNLSAQTGRSLGHGFIYLGAVASGLLSSAGLDSGQAQVSGTLVLQPGRRHVAVLHGSAGWQKNNRPGGEYDLGAGFGPRALRLHAFTGDRYVFSMAEYRWTAAEDLWGLVGVGLAGFVDHGGAWYDGTPRRTGWDAGFGLRLGPSRTPEPEAIRVDLAYRFASGPERAGWVLVIGKGFPFPLQLGRREQQWP